MGLFCREREGGILGRLCGNMEAKVGEGGGIFKEGCGRDTEEDEGMVDEEGIDDGCGREE
jgi:hypothetical protein